VIGAAIVSEALSTQLQLAKAAGYDAEGARRTSVVESSAGVSAAGAAKRLQHPNQTLSSAGGLGVAAGALGEL
jgi:hypothetical protein